jgi:hypothetical protein
MSEKKPKKRTVWAVQDYGNLDVAEYVYKLKGGSGGSGGGTFGSGGEFSLEGLIPGVSTSPSVTTQGGVAKPSPALQATAQEILKDPQAFVDKSKPDDENIVDRGKKMLSSLFDTEDEADLRIGPIPAGAVESVWDGFLKGVGWTYDRISQVTVAGMSALPGGTRTLTWGEADDVSFGQQLVANMGVSAGKINRGEGNLFDILGAGPIGLLAGQLDSDSEIQQEGFDITSEEDRKAFDEGPEKFFSGLADFGFAFADPFLVAGIPLKLTRLKYLDRVFKNDADVIKFRNEEMIKGKEFIEEMEAAGVPIDRTILDQVTPAMALIETSYNGKRSVSSLLEQPEIKDTSHAEAIAIGINEATTREQAITVLMAGLGDRAAYEKLLKNQASVASAIATNERRMMEISAVLNPGQWKKDRIRYKTRQEDVGKELEEAKKLYDEEKISGADLAAVRLKFEELTDNLNAVDDLVAKDPASKKFSPKDSKLAEDEAKALTEQYEYIQRAINAQGSLRQTNRGFASPTALGRAASRRRTRIAENRADIKANRGTWSATEFFSKDGLRRTLRVLRYSPGLENPAYYMAAKGTGAVDLHREASAILTTLKAFTGEGKKTTVMQNGVAKEIIVGGQQAREEILVDFLKSISLQKDVSVSMARFEDNIARTLRDYYGLDTDVMDYVVSKARNSMADTAQRIKDPNRQWFPESGVPETLATLARAPFLESQLMEGSYILPFDELEKILVNVSKGAINPKAAMSQGAKEQSVNRSLFTGKGYIWEKTKDIDEAFQSFWRPLVLFRLGYPMRNVTEGTFRSMVFNQSLAPMFWVGKGLVGGVYNTRRAQRAEKEFNELVSQIGGDPQIRRSEVQSQRSALIDEQTNLVNVKDEVPDLPDKYVYNLDANGPQSYITSDGYFAIVKEVPEEGAKKKDAKWFVYEIDEQGEYINRSKPIDKFNDAKRALKGRVDEAQSRRIDYASQGRPRLAQINKDYGPDRIRTGATEESIAKAKADRIKRLDEIEKEIIELGKVEDSLPLISAPDSIKSKKFNDWREKETEKLDVMLIQPSKLWEDEFLAAKGGWAELSVKEQSDLIKLRSIRNEQEERLRMLIEDDYYAISEYSNRRAQKRFVDSSEEQVLDNGTIIHAAFGNPRYRDIARKNLSADDTIKATLSVRANLSQSLILQRVKDFYVDVSPDMGRQYWEGMQEMLQQYSQSTVGQMLAAGKPNEEIVNWILRNPAGREWRDEMDKATRAMEGGKRWGDKEIGESARVADEYVNSVRASLEYITLGDPRVLKLISERPPTASELQRIMGDQYRGKLNPVVGNKEELTGFKGIMQTWRTITEFGFKHIGTMPEDALVRGPFYAKQYQKFVDDGLELLRQQYKDTDFIPLDRINALEINAHRRALKDTKEFLYTIDRRTNLGRYGEWIFPFISATQNSVVTLGKLTRRDPQTVGLITALWRAPNEAGWEDEDGNLIIPLPKDLIPDGVENFFGLEGITNIKIPKSGLNVLFPETGFAFAPRPGPLVQASASQLMKSGYLISVEPPPAFNAFFGEENATAIWTGFKDYVFGEENGISPNFLSLDKLLPPAANRVFQRLAGDSSPQYAYQYALQARTEDLRWRAGERETYPTNQEIIDRTNGQFTLRILGNLLAFTPPDYEYAIQPLIEMQRIYDQEYQLDGPMRFSENFGNETLILSNTDTTKNVGGALSNMKAVGNIRKYSDLISGLSPRLGDDLSILGIIVNDKAADAEYDPSAYRWLSQEEIPGASKNWRELLSGPESMRESQRTAGWVEFTKFMGSLDAMLEERGLSSYRVKAAEDLNSFRKEKIAMMKEDPMYEGWRIDYEDIGAGKAEKTLMVLNSALNNQEFMKDKGDSGMWQNAALYLEGRNQTMAALDNNGQPLTDEYKDAILTEWDEFRQSLKSRDNDWTAIANRYLGNDDDPSNQQSTVSLFEGGM